MNDSFNACLLCGNDRRNEVRTGLVQWKEPIDGKRFDSIPRCSDRVACRLRVEDVNEESWPLVDAERRAWEAAKPSAAPPLSETAIPAVAPAPPSPDPSVLAPFADEPEEVDPWS